MARTCPLHPDIQYPRLFLRLLACLDDPAHYATPVRQLEVLDSFLRLHQALQFLEANPAGAGGVHRRRGDVEHFCSLRYAPKGFFGVEYSPYQLLVVLRYLIVLEAIYLMVYIYMFLRMKEEHTRRQRNSRTRPNLRSMPRMMAYASVIEVMLSHVRMRTVLVAV